MSSGKRKKETLFIHGIQFKAISLWSRVGEMLVLGEMGKPEYPEKNLSEQEGEPTNSAPFETPDRRIEPGPHLWEARVFLLCLVTKQHQTLFVCLKLFTVRPPRLVTFDRL